MASSQGSKSGEHIVPSPENIAAFVHATALSMKQILSDTQTYWGPVEWTEYHNAMRAKLAATPDDAQLIQFCHAINLMWSEAKQRAMLLDRFGE